MLLQFMKKEAKFWQENVFKLQKCFNDPKIKYNYTPILKNYLIVMFVL